ncbi:UDP-N-acetylmuramoyl-L-alanine--D-glutamate ligase [Salipaludibacillus agaradhaerens]|uniref:UDP-N-acetylmuramoylalanine--D-glutamate ligase n=1 Tax=Salipaludibacillus agaradhaerens TaxID=76935 RepID=A0A9Q4FYP3_SALAG|nr:UDP-N-acetylmuramoyl-L-alanine--D-glutamate ligase [Salipaludibacillus agaradhaerens]MCR6095944.1 UDP-N-acetylmuramoyl-L-alanine--D-glutamate ligase [Salipaludibacillus agaradhaerens]MCR6114497.1 UDP-N-acetylmuramoyl-L-alanine--D-glutamate ligase [Salipaludibacillus agaradhaerens]
MKMINDFKGKKVLVLGLAKSGTEAARLLKRLGACVIVNDRNSYEGNVEAKQLETEGIDVVCGSHPESLVTEELDYLVKNPGVRYDQPLVAKALALGIPVYTEVELAYRIAESDMIGITGSNGKTTTTTYIGDMLQGGKKSPLLAGNIGKVACKVAQEATVDHEMVVELSSFQLMGTEKFAPHIAILLNFVEAHLDYHGSMNDYVAAKMNVFLKQTTEDYLIYNADDHLVSEVVNKGQARLVPFSTREDLPEGACIKEGWLTVFGDKLLPVEDMSLPGEHNLSNGLAAATAALLAGADREQVCHVLKTFEGVEHRLQYIGEADKKKFYNNSKATNVPATITALKAFQQPVVLIAGGLDRGLSFDGLIPFLSKNVRGVVAYGETSGKLADVAQRANVSHVALKDSLREATDEAFKLSQAGDVILLSPACASWDQFKTFEERGDAFTRHVLDIIHNKK